jgi:hypothetical protein
VGGEADTSVVGSEVRGAAIPETTAIGGVSSDTGDCSLGAIGTVAEIAGAFATGAATAVPVKCSSLPGPRAVSHSRALLVPAAVKLRLALVSNVAGLGRVGS